MVKHSKRLELGLQQDIWLAVAISWLRLPDDAVDLLGWQIPPCGVHCRMNTEGPARYLNRGRRL
jgi:hypothetical protein